MKHIAYLRYSESLISNNYYSMYLTLLTKSLGCPTGSIVRNEDSPESVSFSALPFLKTIFLTLPPEFRWTVASLAAALAPEQPGVVAPSRQA